MTHIAGYGLLAGIIVLYHRAGSALWTDPAVAHQFTGGLFALMLVALVAKSVQVPLHTWIPEAMAAPTPVSALLHSACYVTSGVYLAARMHSFGAWPAAWSQSLMWIGTVTMAVGVMYAMVQTDLKRMLAFSTVSQIGYMMMGIGIGTPLAITAGLLHCLNHGFFKGGLFLTAGSVQHAAGTRDMNKLGGLAGKMPQTTLSWMIGVGSMMGIPLMSGFASKWMLYAAALQAGWAVPAMVAWAASLGTVFLGVKATSAVFLGPATENTKDAHESPPTMIWGMGLLAAGSVVLGVAPQLAVNYFLNPILMALGMGTGVHVTWLGLSADAGSFSSTGGLVLALVSLVVGGAIYLIAYAVRPASAGPAMAGAGGGIFTGGEPLGEQGRLTAGDFSEIFQEHWHSFFRWSNVDRVYLAIWRGIAGRLTRARSALRMDGGASDAASRHACGCNFCIGSLGCAGDAGFNQRACPRAAGSPSFDLRHRHRRRRTLLRRAGKKTQCHTVGLALHADCRRAFGRRYCPQPPLVAPRPSRTGRYAHGSPRLAYGRRTSAKITYLAVVLISAGSLVASEFLSGAGDHSWSRALLLTSVFVKLAAVPLFFWLLALADEVPALVLGLIIAVVDMAAFGEFLIGAQPCPACSRRSPCFFCVAALTSLLAALLMLTQRSLKRLLVLSTVEDVGFLLLGVASASALGIEGALIAASTHALAKALLFTCLAAPEADGALNAEPVALAARYPVSAFGFLFGMLAMLGIPPTLGFIGRWRLYSAAFEIGLCPLAIFIVSSILALIAYTLALTRNWWGPPRELAEPRDMAYEATLQCCASRSLLKAAIVVLVVLLLAAGIWPNAWQLLMGVRL